MLILPSDSHGDDGDVWQALLGSWVGGSERSSRGLQDRASSHVGPGDVGARGWRFLPSLNGTLRAGTYK